MNAPTLTKTPPRLTWRVLTLERAAAQHHTDTIYRIVELAPDEWTINTLSATGHNAALVTTRGELRTWSDPLHAVRALRTLIREAEVPLEQTDTDALREPIQLQIY